MPHQVAVFLENKPGKLERVTGLLAGAGINIRAITIADSGDFGVLKLLVDKPAITCNILAQNGLVATVRRVVAMKIPDKPGGLLNIARILTRQKINIDDAYGFVLKSGETAVFVIQVKDPDTAADLLKAEGIQLLGDNDLYFL
ncbi:MAG: ACT domain-containing protein [Candidatus Euphemobacter frigidus]|nr:ACT domain-containing protein [Candidatus Euphemobacter frigidus]MDP8275681.1 ACT domain-containing protein [Candidatus Euphemobacter frigidus]